MLIFLFLVKRHRRAVRKPKISSPVNHSLSLRIYPVKISGAVVVFTVDTRVPKESHARVTTTKESLASGKLKENKKQEPLSTRR